MVPSNSRHGLQTGRGVAAVGAEPRLLRRALRGLSLPKMPRRCVRPAKRLHGVCSFVCVYIYIYIHVCVCVCACVCVCVSLCVFVFALVPLLGEFKVHSGRATGGWCKSPRFSCFGSEIVF